MEIILRSVRIPEDLAILETWQKDTETTKRMGGIFPIGTYVTSLHKDPKQYLYIIEEAGEIKGLLQCERKTERSIVVGLLIAPNARQNGIGTRIIKMLPSLPVMKGVKEVLAYIEWDNMNARSCFQKGGFQLATREKDQEGFFLYKKTYTI